MKTRTLLALVALAPLGACAAPPRPAPLPEVALPSAFPGAASPLRAAEPLSEPDEEVDWARWWTQFGDPELNRVVERSLAGNLDLAARFHRVRAARIAARAAGAPARPRLDAFGDYRRNRPSPNQFAGSVGDFSGAGDPDDALSAGGTASWELDLWGRIAREEAASGWDADAAEEEQRAMEVSLVAEVAEAWFDLSEARAEKALHEETAALLERTLSLIRTRIDAGLSTEIDLRRTEGDLAEARALVPDAERRAGIAERRVLLLQGAMPGKGLSVRTPSGFREPVEVPVGVPGTLIARRPDLRALQRRLDAADARVGAACADFYPRVTLFARGALQSVSPDTLLRWESRTWSIGPSIELPILDGGRREFAYLQAEAVRDAAAAEWIAAVTKAVHEVADGIAGTSSRREVRARYREAVEAGRRSVELADVRYREGLTSYLEVLDAQRALAVSKRALLHAERDALSEIVRLSRALGGGWQLPPAPGTPPAKPKKPLPAKR